MTPYKNLHYLVTDPDLLGGKVAIRGPRLSAAFVLECLAQGLDSREIRETYGDFPEGAISELLHVAASILETPCCRLAPIR